MFTGIVQKIGSVEVKELTDAGISLKVQADKTFLEGIEVGASIAVNGVCLTVVTFDESSVSFDVIPETLRVTNLEDLSVNANVNLERSLKFGDEVGGHILSGHISCKAPGELVKTESETELVIKCPGEWINYILLKGYVSINGASLTVAKISDESFSVFLIPETLHATNLSEVESGDLLNIEVDQATYAAVKAAESRIEQN